MPGVFKVARHLALRGKMRVERYPKQACAHRGLLLAGRGPGRHGERQVVGEKMGSASVDSYVLR